MADDARGGIEPPPLSREAPERAEDELFSGGPSSLGGSFALVALETDDDVVRLSLALRSPLLLVLLRSVRDANELPRSRWMFLPFARTSLSDSSSLASLGLPAFAAAAAVAAAAVLLASLMALFHLRRPISATDASGILFIAAGSPSLPHLRAVSSSAVQLRRLHVPSRPQSKQQPSQAGEAVIYISGPARSRRALRNCGSSGHANIDPGDRRPQEFFCAAGGVAGRGRRERRDRGGNDRRENDESWDDREDRGGMTMHERLWRVHVMTVSRCHDG